jgi:hypothetical protein
VPAVWNTCQLFFQCTLLAGYGYAYFATTRLGLRAQLACHLVALGLPVLVLPIAVPSGWEPDAGNPIGPLLGLLAVSVGLPFFVVSTTAPLLQRWYAAGGGPGASDPYFLYAVSNLGSLLALLGYPLLIEPNLTLAQQGRLWAAGFGAFALFLAWAGWSVYRAARSTGGCAPAPTVRAAPVPGARRQRLAWVALALVPSCLLLGVTTHLTTDVAPIPLLWVLPLALYLLSFVLAFLKSTRWARPAPVWIFLVALFLVLSDTYDLWTTVTLHLVLFFSAALALHGELARRRPPVERLTEYYLCVSVGGALGGFAVAILAPLLLNGYYEYGAALVLACLLLPNPFASPRREPGRYDRLVPLVLGAIVAVVLAVGETTPADVEVLYRSRNFFGVVTVTEVSESPQSTLHKLKHGTTQHGVQVLAGNRARRLLPRAYYFPTGPIGQVFLAEIKRGRAPPVAVIGLGTGSLAAYANRGQEFTFFEIDPDVVKVASDPKYFTFLSECPGRVRVELGDARFTLAREPSGHYGILVVDAFSSDSIPAHLLTTGALDVYLDKVAADGLIAFHVTNKYLDLAPVLDGLARARGLHGLIQHDDHLSQDDVAKAKYWSSWVVLARTTQVLRHLAADRRWKPLPGAAHSPVWTDDFSNLLGVLRAGH